MTVDLGAGFLRSRARRLAGAGAARPLVAVRRVADRALASRWQEGALLGIALVAILLMRDSFLTWQSGDYQIFLSQWYAFLQQHGFAGLGQEFADYNVPYLYLLWLGTLTGLDGLHWIKLLSSVSDVALALGAFALLRQLGTARFVAAGSAVLLLLLPEVLLNSAIWGQADSLYTAILVWAMTFLMRDRDIAAWVLYTLALAFKLQSLFVLPAFALVLIIRKHRVRALLWAGVAFALTYVPALIAGRSLASLLLTYSKQSQEYKELTMAAPSLYAWLPQPAFDQFKGTGTLFAIGVASVMLAILIRRFRTLPLTSEAILHVAAVFGLLIPFTLPAMHERYFYVGNVALFLLVVVRRRLLAAALVAQVVVVQVYSPHLFGPYGLQPMFGIPLLALMELGIVTAVLWPLVVPPRIEPAAVSSATPAPTRSDSALTPVQ